jgi:hypothetical protein
LEETLRKAIRTLLFCSITKNHLDSNDSSSTQDTKEGTPNSIDGYKKML